ncbi:MAG TPA: glycine cleavage system aminomethyltransferase GcvT [Polyangiaceae bacterium]|nr:glycine cleavage system aminomethyltransferase GcvT [Polyangiaceae bacterium]
MTSGLARTPLFELHKALDARLVPFAGWEMPVQYQGVKQEHLATRSAIGLFDVSHMGQLEVTGSGALAEVNRLITNDLERAVDGQALYTGCCNEQGTLLDDLIVYRLHPAHILIVCNASNHDKIVAHFQAQLSNRVRMTDHGQERCLIAVQGPKAISAVSSLLTADAGAVDLGRELPPFRTREFVLAERAGLWPKSTVRVARTGYTGEDGVEIFCANAIAPALFRELMARGGTPCGLAARDTLRLEACLCLYGHEINESTDPLEAGIGWTVKLDKSDFIGKAALVQRKAQGPSRKLVGFEMTGRGIARSDYPLLDLAGKVVGHCTSGAPCPTTGKNLGLGYLPVGMTAIGTEFLVDCRGKNITAQVIKTPFYRRA